MTTEKVKIVTLEGKMTTAETEIGKIKTDYTTKASLSSDLGNINT